MDPILERYYVLEAKIKAYNPNLDTERLFAAFTYADSAHSGQLTIWRASMTAAKPAIDQHASHAACIIDSASGRSELCVSVSCAIAS